LQGVTQAAISPRRWRRTLRLTARMAMKEGVNAWEVGLYIGPVVGQEALSDPTSRYTGPLPETA
jgi:hypothetical protein